jgi:hypothetical protein
MHKRHAVITSMALGQLALACSAATPPSPAGREAPQGAAARAGAGGGVAVPAGSDPGRPVNQPGAAAPSSIDDCAGSSPAQLDDETIRALMAGGPTDDMRWLYPYDETVFPRGLLPPTLMWQGPEADFVYVHLQSSSFEYRGCVKPTAPGQLILPKAVWEAAGARTLGARDPFLLELTSMGAGRSSGPIAQRLVIAEATISGSIFYNTYGTRLTGLPGTTGAVLRIPPGGTAELFIANECNGCHSLSADGSRLISQTLLTGGRSYRITPQTGANPNAQELTPRAAFGALYPDGSLMLSTSTAVDVARASVAAAGSSSASELYETDTNRLVPDTGIPGGALMPTFSPDGRVLVFNDFAIDEAHGLALMDFDFARRQAGNHRVVFRDRELRPGWPFMLPDNAAVVFTRTDGVDFTGQGAGLAGTSAISGMPGANGAAPDLGIDWMQFLPGGSSGGGSDPTPPRSDLYIVDIRSGQASMLARAMGYPSAADAETDSTYLPFDSAELHMNYFPTVAPIGAGGYFWVFFDSVRHYGNQGLQRQLWGAAIEIAPDGDYSRDRSHPAFYLPGQELGTGNHRAFAALDPCRTDGESCTSGADCCGGFCAQGAANPEFTALPGTCASTPQDCAQPGDRCSADGECCPDAEGDRTPCIAGFCTALIVPQ